MKTIVLSIGREAEGRLARIDVGFQTMEDALDHDGNYSFLLKKEAEQLENSYFDGTALGWWNMWSYVLWRRC